MDQTNQADECEWSDEKCVELANKHYFPSSVNNIDVQKGIITNFFSFYLDGKCPLGLDVNDVVFAVLSLVTVTPTIDEAAWAPSQYKQNGSLFFLSPEEKRKNISLDSEQQPSTSNVNTQQETNKTSKESKESIREVYTNGTDSSQPPPVTSIENVNEVRTNISTNTTKQDECEKEKSQNFVIKSDLTWESSPILQNIPVSIKWFSSVSARGVHVDTSQPKTYGHVENAAFINSVSSLLERWSQDSSARAMLKYFFAVISLVLMRATAKSKKHLFSAFTNEKFDTLIKFSQNHITFMTPHKRCTKAAYRAFMKRDKNTPEMFAKVIIMYNSLPEKHKLKLTIKNALLTHTSGYGFNLVNLWRTIEGHFASTPQQAAAIAKVSCIKSTLASWTRLVEFFKKYDGQELHYWARVLNTEYFKDLSCQQNHQLAVILAVFVEKLTGNTGIWQSTWVHSGDLIEAKEVANTIYEIYLANKQKILRTSV